MKNRCNIHITILVLMSIIVLTLISGCSSNINGSGILSKEQIKGHDLVTVNVTFFDADNRLKSPIATLTSESPTEQPYVQQFRDIIANSKGISIDSDNKFSPISDSSHYIEAIYDNDYKLDFYYSQEDNWLIWSNVVDQDEQKIVEYHFLSPKTSVEEWLSTIKPLAAANE